MSPLDKFTILLIALVTIALVWSFHYRFARRALKRQETGRQRVKQLVASPVGTDQKILNQINRYQLRGRRSAQYR